MADTVITLEPQPALPARERAFGDRLRLYVLPLRAVLHLRLSARALPGAGDIRIAGQPLPQAPNSWSGDDPVICCVAPDTWLLLSALHGPAELEAAVHAGRADRLCTIVDLSDAHAALALEGPDATAILARGCGLGLSESGFGPDACTNTRFAQLPVLLRRAARQRFELIADRSVAQYLVDWIEDAAAGLDHGA